jgi:citrate synthase
MESVGANGLEGVEVARTALSDVDGERGRLVIAGHDVEALAGRASFEDVCLMLVGRPRSRPEESERLRPRSARRASAPSRRSRPRQRARDEGRDGRAARRGRAPDAPADEDDGRVLVTAATAVFVAAGAASAPASRRSPPTRRARTPPTTCGWPRAAASARRRSRAIS